MCRRLRREPGAWQGDSNQLTPKWFSDRNLPFFRLLSVDASHDLKLVLRDFNLAGCLVIDGGIVIADDFGGASWMGVNSALYNFVFEQSRIVPFMMARPCIPILATLFVRLAACGIAQLVPRVEADSISLACSLEQAAFLLDLASIASQVPQVVQEHGPPLAKCSC